MRRGRDLKERGLCLQQPPTHAHALTLAHTHTFTAPETLNSATRMEPGKGSVAVSLVVIILQIDDYCTFLDPGIILLFFFLPYLFQRHILLFIVHLLQRRAFQ